MNLARRRTPHIDTSDEPEQAAAQPRLALDRLLRLLLAELDVALLLLHRAAQDVDRRLVIERIDHRVERLEHEAFALRHLERDVLGPRAAHHAGREEAHRGMCGLGLAAEHRHDAQEVVDVLHLLERLPREELRGLEIGRVVQPVTDLDAGDLAVEELVEHPLEQLLVALGSSFASPKS